MTERLKAAIFDWDGTIANSARLQVIAEQATALAFAQKHDLPFKEHRWDWDRFKGWGRTKIAAKIFDADPALAEEFREDVTVTTNDFINETILKPIEGVQNFMDHLKGRGLILGVATSSNAKIYHPSVTHFKMEDYFRFAVCHREAIDDKPLPGPFRKVMNHFDVTGKQTLVIEDSKSGIDAGVAAGALVLAIATTEPIDYLRSQTRAHLIAEDYEHATYLVDPYLP